MYLHGTPRFMVLNCELPLPAMVNPSENAVACPVIAVLIYTSPGNQRCGATPTYVINMMVQSQRSRFSSYLASSRPQALPSKNGGPGDEASPHPLQTHQDPLAKDTY